MVWSSQCGAAWFPSVRAFAGIAIVVQSMTTAKPSKAKIVIVASSVLRRGSVQVQARESFLLCQEDHNSK
jgi:hypothetical protein